MVRFGPWSTTLGLAAAFGALVALLLLFARGNRPANALLAALIGVAVLRLMPYVLGYAGFYDAYPWLSFAPFDLALAIGPLLYLYVRRLATPALPRGWGWHFAPAAIDLAYMLWAFALPIEAKGRWNDAVHVPFVDPVQAGAAIASLAAYLVATLRFVRRYQAWLAENVSDRYEHRQPWVTTVLAALGVWLAAAAGFELVDRFVSDLDYFDRFPQYLLFSAIVLLLGLEGWRHAGHRFPTMVLRAEPAAPAGRDWAATGAEWRERIRAEGWWRDPRLTLAAVARRLATNESYVSRAFNDGLARNFNAVVNGLRVEAVQARLAADDGADLLTMALDAGFASKASFNRAFRDHSGMSPSAWRASQIPARVPNPASGATAPVDPA